MKSFLFLLILLSPLSSFSQDLKDLTPLEITERFLGKDGFSDKNLYLCCEMKQDMKADSSLGQYITDSVSRSFELLYQDSTSAVTSVELSTSKSEQDWYFYFKRDSYWKIEAMRALAMTGFAAKLLEMYENMSEDSLKIFESLLPGKRNIKKDIMRYRLELSSDKELIQYFTENKNSFERLKNIYFDGGFDKMEDWGEKFNNDSLIKESFDSLLISSFTSIGRFESGMAKNCFSLGGMLDNTFGYFYEPDRTKVPKISKSGFIMIREIGDGWYLYKTT